jgi:molecular chaperone DnaK (HSP70)
MQPDPMRLGIDYGTATTVAMLSRPAGSPRPVLIDGAPTMPSGVFVDPDNGQIVTGVQAQQHAQTRPDRYVPDPKQHATTGRLTIGGRDIDVADLIAATLRQIKTEAVRAAGEAIAEVILTVPPSWGPNRRPLMHDAAARAGLPKPALVAEPIAAANWLHAIAPNGVPTGACVLVCDAGAASLTVSVLQNHPSPYRRNDDTRWQVWASEADPAAGGHAVDDIIATYAGSVLAAADPNRWDRIRQPTTTADRRERHALWQAARQATHTLRHTPRAPIPLPAPHQPVTVDHEQFAALTAPVIERAAHLIDHVIDAADIDLADLNSVVLTGAAACLPGLHKTLGARSGRLPTVPDRPAQILAHGALEAPITIIPAAAPSNTGRSGALSRPRR